MKILDVDVGDVEYLSKADWIDLVYTLRRFAQRVKKRHLSHRVTRTAPQAGTKEK